MNTANFSNAPAFVWLSIKEPVCVSFFTERTVAARSAQELLVLLIEPKLTSSRVMSQDRARRERTCVL